MDLSATNSYGLTLDEVLQNIKTGLDNTDDNTDDSKEMKLSEREYILPSIISDPSKYVKEKVDKTKRDDEKHKYYDEMRKNTLRMISESMVTDPKLEDIDELYLEGKEDEKKLDEHPFMSKLDCKSRTEYCFTNKELSKMCFKTGNYIHDTYILPCKLRTELKKMINYINNQDIEKYVNNQYLNRAVLPHIQNVLPKFGFKTEEIDSLLHSARDYDKKINLFYIPIPEEYDRGIYIKYLLDMFQKDNQLLHNFINKYIDTLIFDLKYKELDAIDSGFKFLNTLLLGSETFDNLEEYYKELSKKKYNQLRSHLYSSDSE